MSISSSRLFGIVPGLGRLCMVDDSTSEQPAADDRGRRPGSAAVPSYFLGGRTLGCRAWPASAGSAGLAGLACRGLAASAGLAGSGVAPAPAAVGLRCRRLRLGAGVGAAFSAARGGRRARRGRCAGGRGVPARAPRASAGRRRHIAGARRRLGLRRRRIVEPGLAVHGHLDDVEVGVEQDRALPLLELLVASSYAPSRVRSLLISTFLRSFACSAAHPTHARLMATHSAHRATHSAHHPRMASHLRGHAAVAAGRRHHPAHHASCMPPIIAHAMPMPPGCSPFSGLVTRRGGTLQLEVLHLDGHRRVLQLDEEVLHVVLIDQDGHRGRGGSCTGPCHPRV